MPKKYVVNQHYEDDGDAETPNVNLQDVATTTQHSRFVVMCILLTELCERMTFYSISANLLLFCTSKLGFSDPNSTTVQFVFTGTCYIIPVIGGWIADTVAGKYNTIYGAGLIYVVGTFLLVGAAIDYEAWIGSPGYDLSKTGRAAYYLAGLALVAVGTGGIKANVGPYGAEQAEDMGENAVQSFFNWFYFFVNTGSFIAYSGVAYVQQNISFAYGFLIPLISMVMAIVFLLIGRSRYKNTPIKGSILSTTAKIVVQGCKRRGTSKAKTVLDNAKRSYGGTFADGTVEGIKSLGRVIPVFFTIIMYWALYSQMTGTFFLQSERMDVYIRSFKPPAASPNLLNVIIILILIPLMDRVVYPAMERIGRKPSLLQRIGFGMILATLSVVAAGVLEIYRKKDLERTGGHKQELGGKIFNSSSLSMFLQIPQFALIGASEVFTSVTGLEFAFSQAPYFLRGLIMGLFLLTSGLGNYLSEAIMEIVRAATKSHQWFPDEINDGYTEYMYFLLGGLMMLDFFVFLGVAKCYHYRREEEPTAEPMTEKQLPAHDNHAYSADTNTTM